MSPSMFDVRLCDRPVHQGHMTERLAMRVLVTGSSGKVGREAVASLKAAGHQVIGLDLKAGMDSDVRTIACDCTDFGQVMGVMSGVDTLDAPEAVVHLAGIPAPGLAPDAEIFRTNTLGNYNVFTAATRAGIRRIVWASSETILGLPFDMPPDFVPLDESHPDRPEWSYSLTKKIGETIADELVRWHPDLVIVSLRFSNVCDADDYAQRAASVADPSLRKMNLWSYVDVRDTGEACRLAVEADLRGHERLIIAAADTLIDTPTAELMRTHFPDVLVKAPLEGFRSLESSARAAELIGYRPQHSWRDQ
jgi:nucleoside-diphosphate-sugar epimerase